MFFRKFWLLIKLNYFKDQINIYVTNNLHGLSKMIFRNLPIPST